MTNINSQLKYNRTVFFVVLLFFSSIGRMICDLYLPGLPDIERSLNTTESYIQLTISVYLFGYAISQLIYGPLSDGIGRKIPIYIGLTICVIGSIVCVNSSNIIVFLIGRLLQGLGTGVNYSLSRPVLRDVLTGIGLAKFSSYLALCNIVLASMVPLLGGFILTYFNWHAFFITQIIYLFSIICIVYAFLPETNQNQHRDNLRFARIKSNICAVLSHREFIAYSLVIFLSYSGIIGWNTVSAIILRSNLHLSPLEFGWVSCIIGFVFAFGSYINARLVKVLGLSDMLRWGALLMLCGSSLMLVLGYAFKINLLIIMLPLSIYMFGEGFIFSNAFAMALTPFPKIAGIAGSVFSFLQILGGFSSSSILSIIHDKSQFSLGFWHLTSSLGILFVLEAVQFLNKSQRSAIKLLGKPTTSTKSFSNKTIHTAAASLSSSSQRRPIPTTHVKEHT